jgi:PKD repeat protein
LVSGGVSSVTPVYTNTTELYNPKPVITSLLTASAVKDVAFSYTITAVGANPITFTTSALPAGLTLSAGVISGIPTVTGTFSITLIATNVAGSDSQTLVLIITPPVAPIITSALATIAIKGSAFTYQITATGTLSRTYSATGLPAGLTLVGDTLTGTPTVGGVYPVVLLATNVAGSDSKTLTIAIGKGGAPNAVSVFTSSPTATPNPALVGQVITLLAVATDADGDAMSYTWDFGDGTTGTGASPTHTYAATGIYLVKITVFDGVSTVTSTVTITVTAVGSAVAQPLSLQKASIKFNFAKSSGGDSMSFTGTLPLAKGFTPSGKTLTVKTGTYLSSFTLLGKGSGVAGHDSIKLTGKLKNGAFTTTPVKFVYTVKSSTVFSSLSSLGFTNADTAGTSISVPVTLVIDGTTYAGTISVNYKATGNRNGSAK